MKKTKQTGLMVMIAVTILSVAVMLSALLLTGKEQKAEFVPPPFDPAAQAGTPVVPDDLAYGELYQDGMAYRFSICGMVTAQDSNAIVYLTNPAENDVWLKVRLYSEIGELLGESGLIRPGEYVEGVALSTIPQSGTPIKMKIMGYVPESYHSAGAVVLNTEMYTAD